MNRIRKILTGHEKAQSLAEFALILPMFLILVFGIIDFGMGLRAYISLSSATREGARYAAVGNPAGAFTSGGSGQCNGTTTNTTVGRVCSTINGLDLTNVDSVTVTYPNGNTPGRDVRVRAQYSYEYITPIDGIISVLSGGNIDDELTITSQTDMRLE